MTKNKYKKGMLIRWEPSASGTKYRGKGYCICEITDADPEEYKQWGRNVMKGRILIKKSKECHSSVGKVWAFYQDQAIPWKMVYNKKREAL